MESHRDRDHDKDRIGQEQTRRRNEFTAQLQQRATELTMRHANEITAGSPAEDWIERWHAEQLDIHVGKRPDDPQGILRISIGGGDALPITANYCVFRGDRNAVIQLLERATQALRNHPAAEQPPEQPAEQLETFGCTDGDCIFRPENQHRMHTNAGCRCLRDAKPRLRAQLRAFIRQQRATIESLRGRAAAADQQENDRGA